MSINNKIADLLKKKEISQTELAKRTGLSQQNLNRLLNSDDIKVSQLIEISKALEVAPTYFFDGTETLSNEVVDGYKKRIKELEQIVKDREYFEFQKFYIALTEILAHDTEFKTIDDKFKEEIVDYVCSAYGKSEVDKMIYDISILSKKEIKSEIKSAIFLIKTGRNTANLNDLINNKD